MVRRALLLMALFVVGPAVTCRAHFIWLDVEPSGQPAGSPQVRLYFGEVAAPGEPHLIAKAAGTKAWARRPNGEKTELKLAPPVDAKLAALVADWTSTEPASLEAACDYGVYERGPGVLLHYYAKRLVGPWSGQQEKLARAERLDMDIVPSLKGDKLELAVIYRGKPVASGELAIVDANGEERTVVANEAGIAELPAKPGRLALRAGYVEADKGGVRDGKKYAQTWHYCTLILDVPPGSEAAAAAKSAELSAAELLVRARAVRSIWQNFPGFSADITVTSESGPVEGKITIDGEGNVKLTMDKSPVADWVEEQLQTLVQHRMPDGEVAEGDIKYAEQDGTHPLGRKIDLGDPSSQSVYRVKDDVIMEVNRNAGPMRFTISVLEISRNAENKYLPRSFTMNFFDKASGDLKTSLAYFNDWQRVGEFDLPRTILETGAHRGGAHTRQLTFSNCRLLEQTTRQAKTSAASGR